MRWMATMALVALLVGAAADWSQGILFDTTPSVAMAEDAQPEAETVRVRTWWDSLMAAGWILAAELATHVVADLFKTATLGAGTVLFS